MKVLSLFQRIPYSLKVAILIVILAKILVFSIGYAAVYLHEGASSPLTIITHAFLRQGAPQDGQHYIDIAKNWYINTGDQANLIVYFPLYPILIRLITFDPNYIGWSALAISNFFSIVGFVYLFKLAKLDYDDGVAKKAVLFLSVFPTAYFLSAPYTEGLFFALVLASLYYARLGKWAVSSSFGFFASLTRIGGLLLLPVLIVEYLHQKNWKPRKITANILWISLIIAGFSIYLGLNYQVTGNPFTFITVEKTHWGNGIDPVEGLRQTWLALGRTFPENITTGAAPLVFAIFGLLSVVAGDKVRIRPSYNVYMLLIWILAVSTTWWLSVPRYVVSMFPVFIILGLLSRRKAVTIGVTILFLAALCFFTALFALGNWAF